MTQGLVIPQDVEPDDGEDPLKKLYDEMGAHGARLAAAPNLDKAVRAELGGTVFPFMKDIVLQLVSLRDGMAQALEELEGRIEDVEEPETRIFAEDAEKITALCEAAAYLVAIIRGLGAQKPEVEARLADIEKLAAECKTIVEEATVDEDEDEEGDEDGDEPDVQAGG